ncbi:MAG: S8 family serine peptidase [Chloroflexi bacterium]|nr:S8 family serine peptidase [Chloroflexota bacterium]
MVQFAQDVSLQERDAIIAEMGGELLYWLAPLRTAKVRMTEAVNAAGVQSRLAQIATHPQVNVVEPDLPVEGTYEINDPGALDENKSYSTALLNLQSAWNYTTGSISVTIAVLDTGIAKAHPEFAGRILPGYDVVNDDDDPEDDFGHGTHVAGIAAAAINNGIGMAGVCGGCSILPVKVLNDHNAGTWSGVAEGIVYAVDHHANIIVLSLGSKTKSSIIEDAVNYALGHNVLIVAAAGNANSKDNFYPAAYAGVIGVGATGRNNERWPLSNLGDYVDVMAPGDNIYSTYNDLNNEYGGYTFLTGTSMATPHVAGLAGLLLSQEPTRTVADLTRLIETTALDLGDAGRDDKFGYGLINPLAALEAEAPEQFITATLSGLTWQDDDYDGLQGSSEYHRLSGIKVDVYDENLNLVTTTTSSRTGTWVVASLLPDLYTVRAEAPTGMVLTGNAELHIQLSPTDHLDNLNFSFAPLPSLTAQLYLPLITR